MHAHTHTHTHKQTNTVSTRLNHSLTGRQKKEPYNNDDGQGQQLLPSV